MKNNNYWRLILVLTGIIAVLNLAGFSKDFCDFYTDNIYALSHNLIAFLTSWCPFAIGEIIMYLGAVALFLQLLIIVLLIFFRKKKKYTTFVKKYSKAVLMSIVITLFLFTVNWTVPFRARVLKASDNTRTEYSLSELEYVRATVVEQLNRITLLLNRDENGNLIYDYTDEDIAASMRSEKADYPRLDGFYPTMKPAICSPFLEWMNIGGYNYVYTMEPTYNLYVDPITMPVLKAHEYAHNMGYYKENEGEFLSCITLVHSDNLFLQYCGYLEMYWYLDEAVYSALADMYLEPGEEPTREKLAQISEAYSLLPQLSEQVEQDLYYAWSLSVELYEENIDETFEETFAETSSSVASVGWDLQSDVLKENTYDGLTLMLLQYYISE